MSPSLPPCAQLEEVFGALSSSPDKGKKAGYVDAGEFGRFMRLAPAEPRHESPPKAPGGKGGGKGAKASGWK